LELTTIDGELRDSSGKALRFIFYLGSIPVLSTSLDELVKGAQILHIHGSRVAEQTKQTEKYVNAEVFGEDYDLNRLVDRRKQPPSLQVALYCHCCGFYNTLIAIAKLKLSKYSGYENHVVFSKFSNFEINISCSQYLLDISQSLSQHFLKIEIFIDFSLFSQCSIFFVS
jgi:hypothetical protein